MEKYINKLNEIILQYGKNLTREHIKKELSDYYFSTYQVQAQKVKKELKTIIENEIKDIYIDNKVYHINDIGNNNRWEIKTKKDNRLIANININEDIYGGVVYVYIDNVNTHLKFNSNYVVLNIDKKEYIKRFY